MDGDATAVDAATAAAVADLTAPGGGWRADGRFQDVSELYAATRSTVWLAVHAATGIAYAIKAYKRRLLNAVEALQVSRELQLSTAVGPHPNVLRAVASWEDEEQLCVASRYAEQGDLFNVRDAFRGGLLPEALAAQIMLQVTMAVCACHESGILHRDVKPENVVMDVHGVAMLTDFGLAIDARAHRPVSRVGTLDYMAPEVVALPGSREQRAVKAHSSGRASYDASVDVWALGVLAFELLSGAPPFASSTPAHTEFNIMRAQAPLASLDATTGAREFIQACLRAEPAERPTAHELLESPWLEGAAKFLSYCPLLLGASPASQLERRAAIKAAAAQLLEARVSHLAYAAAQRAAAEAANAQASYITEAASRGRGSLSWENMFASGAGAGTDEAPLRRWQLRRWSAPNACILEGEARTDAITLLAQAASAAGIVAPHQQHAAPAAAAAGAGGLRRIMTSGSLSETRHALAAAAAATERCQLRRVAWGGSRWIAGGEQLVVRTLLPTAPVMVPPIVRLNTLAMMPATAWAPRATPAPHKAATTAMLERGATPSVASARRSNTLGSWTGSCSKLNADALPPGAA